MSQNRGKKTKITEKEEKEREIILLQKIETKKGGIFSRRKKGFEENSPGLKRRGARPGRRGGKK